MFSDLGVIHIVRTFITTFCGGTAMKGRRQVRGGGYAKLAEVDKGGRGVNFDQKLVDVIKLSLRFY